jgi:hypothetical protein
MIKTSQVAGRRRLRFESYGGIVEEVRRLATVPTRQLGNWSLAQICQHLATAMELCTASGVGFRAPLKTRIVARLFRKALLNGRLPPGFQLPPEAAAVLVREPASVEAAIAALEQAISGLKQTSQRAPHPVLGSLSASQWDLFHLRHAEMHLSFLVPETAFP